MKFLIGILILACLYLANELDKSKDKIEELSIQKAIVPKDVIKENRANSLIEGPRLSLEEIEEKFKSKIGDSDFKFQDVSRSSTLKDLIEVKTKSNQNFYLTGDAKFLILGQVFNLETNELYRSDSPDLKNMMKLFYEKKIDRFYVRIDPTKLPSGSTVGLPIGAPILKSK